MNQAEASSGDTSVTGGACLMMPTRSSDRAARSSGSFGAAAPRLRRVDRLVHQAEEVHELPRVAVGLPDLEVAGFLDVAADVDRRQVKIRDVEIIQHRQHEPVRDRVAERIRAAPRQ